jgi:Arc/MetJ-type ribon-helix-helix transcriptional regulator
MIGRPETHPVKKVIGFTEEMLVDVESWRAKQKPIPNLSEAIRQLVGLGLRDEIREERIQAHEQHRAAARLAAREAEIAKKRAARKAKGK